MRAKSQKNKPKPFITAWRTGVNGTTTITDRQTVELYGCLREETATFSGEKWPRDRWKGVAVESHVKELHDKDDKQDKGSFMLAKKRKKIITLILSLHIH